MLNQMILTPFFLDEPLPGLEPLATSDWLINRPQLPQGPKQRRLSALHRPLADFVQQSIIEGKRPVSIAGDCCTAIGVLAGLQRAGLDPLLIWFDAHGDFNTWETTPSGFLGGMPLAMLVGRGEQSMIKALEVKPLAEYRVILTDARDLDPAEKRLVEEAAVVHLADTGALQDFVLPEGPIYVHIDTDIIDPAQAPAMNYPAAGGPSAENLQAVMRHLSRTERIAAVSVSSWNPQMDKDGQSRRVCMELLDELITHRGASLPNDFIGTSKEADKR
jgi:arginase